MDWLVKHLAIPQLGVYTIRNDSPAELWRVAPLALCAALILWIQPKRAAAVGVGMVLGGVIANSVDRALFGPVSDFISFPIDPMVYYNLADLSIGIGLAVTTVSYCVKFAREWRAARAVARGG